MGYSHLAFPGCIGRLVFGWGSVSICFSLGIWITYTHTFIHMNGMGRGGRQHHSHQDTISFKK